MTATRARSNKVRPQVDACPDQERLGTFPPPTEWSEQLAAENLALASAMASRLARSTRMNFDDLYLVAAMGLLKGCRRFDPERINPGTGKPYKLSTCVVPFIRGAMFQWLRDKGHSSGVRFPDRWRDKAPAVRRMAAKGHTLEEVTAASGLSVDDVEGILRAQGITQVFDPDHQDCSTTDAEPDPWDDLETQDNLAEAMRIADVAHYSLQFADRAMLEYAWDEPRKRKLARLQHGQFMVKVKGVIRAGGHWPPPQIVEQPTLLMAGQTPQQILEAAEQLGLFGEVSKIRTRKKPGKLTQRN